MAVEYNGVNHFAISVADLEESIEWYSRVWGFTVIDRSEIPGENVKVAHLQGKGFILEIFAAEGSEPEMEAMGVEIVFIAIVDNTWGCFIHDNSGNLIEIFEEKGDNPFNQHKQL